MCNGLYYNNSADCIWATSAHFWDKNLFFASASCRGNNAQKLSATTVKVGSSGLDISSGINNQITIAESLIVGAAQARKMVGGGCSCTSSLENIFTCNLNWYEVPWDIKNSPVLPLSVTTSVLNWSIWRILLCSYEPARSAHLMQRCLSLLGRTCTHRIP